MYNLTKFNKNRYLRSLSTFEVKSVAKWSKVAWWFVGGSLCTMSLRSYASFCGLELRTADGACAKLRHHHRLGGNLSYKQ